MPPFSFVRWLQSLRRSSKKTYRSKYRFRLSLEELEHRMAPASHVWTGGAGASDPNWRTAANWSTPLPTAASFKDADGQYPDLVFPSGATVLTTTNNIPTTSGLPIYKSITISGNNYRLTGNA